MPSKSSWLLKLAWLACCELWIIEGRVEVAQAQCGLAAQLDIGQLLIPSGRGWLRASWHLPAISGDTSLMSISTSFPPSRWNKFNASRTTLWPGRVVHPPSPSLKDSLRLAGPISSFSTSIWLRHNALHCSIIAIPLIPANPTRASKFHNALVWSNRSRHPGQKYWICSRPQKWSVYEGRPSQLEDRRKQ